LIQIIVYCFYAFSVSLTRLAPADKTLPEWVHHEDIRSLAGRLPGIQILT
jgi:hypothetical protein